MTDIANVGFSTDTGPLKSLSDQVDSTKQSVKGLNDEMQRTPPAAQAAAASLNQVNAAAQSVKNAGADTAMSNVSQGLAKTGDAALQAATGMTQVGTATKTVAQSLDGSLSPSVQRATGFLSTFRQAFLDSFNNAISQASAPIAEAGKVTQQLEDYVSRTGASYTQAAEAIKTSTAAQAAMNETTKTSGSVWQSIKDTVLGYASGLGGATSAMGTHTTATKSMEAEHERANATASELRETMHTLEAPLDALGLKFSTISQFSGAARAGLLALGASIAGDVLVEMQKMADESEILRTRLEGLAGLSIGDRLAEEFEKAVNGVDKLPESTSAAVEAIVKFQQVQLPQFITPAQVAGFQDLKVNSEAAVEAVKTLYEQMRLGGASSSEAIAATNKFFQEAQQNGKITAQSFQQLQDASPAAAQAITNVFFQGRASASQFIEALKQQPASVQSIIRALQQMSTATDSSFRSMIANPKTVQDALEKLRGAFNDLGHDANQAFLGADQGPGMVTRAINFLADGIEEINRDLPGMKAQFDLTSAATKSWSDMIKTTADDTTLFGTRIDIDIVGAVEKALITIGDFVNQAPQQMADFANSSIASIEGWATKFVQSISTALSTALSNIQSFASQALAALQSVSSAITSAAGSAANAASGAIGANMANAASPTGVDMTGASFDNSNITQSTDSNVVPDSPFPGFATGGSFTVGGSGGTDSQLIQFMATPGEQVTIDQPGGSATGGTAAAGVTLGSLIPGPDTGPASAGAPAASPDLLVAGIKQALDEETAKLTDAGSNNATNIAAAVNTSSTNIVNQLKLMSGVAAPVTTTGTGAPSTTSGASGAASSSTSSLPSGGGGGGTGNAFKDIDAAQKAADQEAAQEQQASARAAASGFNPIGGTPGIGQSIGDSSEQTSGGGGQPKQKRPTDYGATQSNQPLGANGLPVTGPSGSPDLQQYGPLNNIDTSQPSPGTVPVTVNGKTTYVPKEEPGAPVQGYGTMQEVPSGGSGDLKQQTDTLKSSQDTGFKSVSDAVQQQADAARQAGDQTAQRSQQVADAVQQQGQQAQQIGQQTIAQAQQDSATATQGNSLAQAGNDLTQSIGDQTDQTLQQGNSQAQSASDQNVQGLQANQQATETGASDVANATTTGSGNVTDAVNTSASTISQAISQAIGSLASSMSAAQASSATGASDTGGDTGSFNDTGSSDVSGVGDIGGTGTSIGDNMNGAGGLPMEEGFATGGQFLVRGPGHADTEHISFMASPGETITITPPGGAPPPNPSMDSHAAGGRKSGYATGGQMTLGGAMGTPTVPQESADLLTSHMASLLSNQAAQISDKIGVMGQNIIASANDSASTIQQAISTVASKIPDPVAPVAAAQSSSSVAGSASSGGSSGLTMQNAFGPVNQLTSDGAYVNGVKYLMGPNGYQKAFATGGQFMVGGGTGLPSFATGGQITAGSNDNADPGADVVSNSIDSKVANATDAMKKKIDTATGSISNAMSSNNNSIVAAVNAIGDRFDAWHASVDISPHQIAAPAMSGFASSSGSASGPFVGASGQGLNMLTSDGAIVNGSKYVMGPNGYQQVGFATGGQFTVNRGLADGGVLTVPGGQSGTDSVDVQVKAAPGEKIMVLPADQAAKMKAQAKDTQQISAEPIEDYLPKPLSVPGNSGATATSSVASGMSSASAPVAANSNRSGGAGGDRPIIIQVQQGVTADQFIRSRAQIAGAFK